MQQLERFQYITVLDLNMVYYTIMFSPDSQDMMAIITESEKFRYSRLPITMFTPREIFQAKADKRLSDIKGAKTHFDYKLVLRNESFSKHI